MVCGWQLGEVGEQERLCTVRWVRWERMVCGQLPVAGVRGRLVGGRMVYEGSNAL